MDKRLTVAVQKAVLLGSDDPLTGLLCYLFAGVTLPYEPSGTECCALMLAWHLTLVWLPPSRPHLVAALLWQFAFSSDLLSMIVCTLVFSYSMIQIRHKNVFIFSVKKEKNKF